MRILTVHHFYQQAGGEDQVFTAETELLQSRGHDVSTFTVHNDRVEAMSKPEVAGRTLWNSQSHKELTAVVRERRPHIVHFHNTLPLVSPAGYYAARAGGAVVVQTLHNYRLICPGSLLYRDGAVCETCITKRFKWPAVAHGCYRENRAASATVAAMLSVHDLAGTYKNAVDAYVALTPFARERFLRGSLPAERTFVKPNFLLKDPGAGAGEGGYALFVGRLSVEKGIDILLQAWQRLQQRIPLIIAGDGPLAGSVRDASDSDDRIRWLGRVGSDEVYSLMHGAASLVFPSTWYEGMPITLIEALACGTPVIASNLGAMADMVQHGKTGYHFDPGSPEALASAVADAFGTGGRLSALRSNARRAFKAEYTAEKNYDQLLQIYRAAAIGAGVSLEQWA